MKTDELVHFVFYVIISFLIHLPIGYRYRFKLVHYRVHILIYLAGTLLQNVFLVAF